MAHILLPALFSICASLGIAKESCTDSFVITGMHQTDQNLWYEGQSSWPNRDGIPPENQCRNPTPIEVYDIYDGSKGTTYACLAPLKDDRITEQELQQIVALAHRLNSIAPKTLEDHQRALTLKNLVQWLGGPPAMKNPQ